MGTMGAIPRSPLREALGDPLGGPVRDLHIGSG